MKFNSFIFIFLIFGLILFSGCGEEKEVQRITCPQDSIYVKYTYHPDTNTCSKKEIPKDKCGNGIAEPKTNNENYCNCPQDIKSIKLPIEKGGCFGNKGEYLEYYCNDNLCDTKITNAVKKVPAKLLTLGDGNLFEFETQVDYYQPFIIDKQKMKLSFMLKNIATEGNQKISNLILRKIYIITDSDEILGQKVLNKEFDHKFDIYEFEFPLKGFTLNSFTKEYSNVGLKILVSFKLNDYDKNGNLVKVEDKVFETTSKFRENFLILDSRNKNVEIKKKVEKKKKVTWG